MGYATLMAVSGLVSHLGVRHWAWPIDPAGQVLLRVAAALLPVMILAVAFYIEDRHEPEPWSNLLRFVLLGVFSIGVADFGRQALIQFMPREWIGATHGAALFGYLLVGIGVSEELAKFACFRLGAWRDREIDEPYDGCIYAAYLSLSFAAVENIGFVLRPNPLEASLGIAALRAATAVPAHALFGAAWGLAFGLAKFNRRRWWMPWVVLVGAIFVHGLFDWLAISAAALERDLVAVLALLAILAVMGVVCIVGIHEAHRLSPHREPVEGEGPR